MPIVFPGFRTKALTFSYDTNILDSVSLGGVKGAKGGN